MFLRRKEKERWFRWALKFGPLHKCPQRQLQVLILAEKPKIKEEGEFVMWKLKEKMGDYEVLDIVRIKKGTRVNASCNERNS